MSEIIKATETRIHCFEPSKDNSDFCAKTQECKFASKTGRYFLGACMHSLEREELPVWLGVDSEAMEGQLKQ